MKKAIILFLLVLSFGILGCGQGRKFLSVGDIAPNFSLADLNGSIISLNDLLKGKEVILSFWASWCPECRQEVPQLDKFSKIYYSKIEIIGINIKESKEQIVSFINAKGITYKILLDTRGEVSNLYGVMGVPTNILINRDGLIKNLNLDARQMESYLRQNN